MDSGIIQLSVIALIVFALGVLAVWPHWKEAKKNQAAFATRDRSNAGCGMVPAAEVADRPFEWSATKNQGVGVAEYELRAGNDCVGRYWLTGSGHLIEAETCDGLWMADREEHGGWSRAFEQTFTVRSVQPNNCEVLVECGMSSYTILGSFEGSIRFSDGCDFAWKYMDASPERFFPLRWLTRKLALCDRQSEVVLELSDGHQITVSKHGASSHHLTLLALLVSYLQVWRVYESYD